EAFVSNSRFDIVKKLIANIKKTMLRSKSRRNWYMDFLKRHGIRKNNQDSDDDDNENEISQLTLRFMPLPNTENWIQVLKKY
ncbi:34953_t:CDS:2, partial [Gigaspora margarita]